MKKVLFALAVALGGVGMVATYHAKATPPIGFPGPAVTAYILKTTAYPPCTYYLYFNSDAERNKFYYGLGNSMGIWTMAGTATVSPSMVGPSPGVQVSECPSTLTHI